METLQADLEGPQPELFSEIFARNAALEDSRQSSAEGGAESESHVPSWKRITLGIFARHWAAQGMSTTVAAEAKRRQEASATRISSVDEHGSDGAAAQAALEGTADQAAPDAPPAYMARVWGRSEDRTS